MISAFGPIGDSAIISLTQSSQRFALGTLAAQNPAIRLIALNASQQAWYVKFGDSAVTVSVSDGMRAVPASRNAPLVLPVPAGATHVAILAEGATGDAQISYGGYLYGEFTPIGASSVITVTQSAQLVALPTLGAIGPCIRLVSKNPSITSLWVKLGNSGVVGSLTTSMKVQPGSVDSPTYIPVTAGQTHLSIFCEGVGGDVVLTGGDLNALSVPQLLSILGFRGNDPFTKILLHLDGTDASTSFPDTNFGGSTRTWTAAGNAQIDTAQSKFGGASLLLDGTGDFISAPDSADFALGSSDWTVDAWFNCVGLSTTGGNICGQGNAAADAAATSFFLGRNAVNQMVLRVSDGVTVGTLDGVTSFTNLTNPGWHHVAAVRTGNVLKLFVDGVQEGGDSAFTGSVQNSAETFTVGARSAGGGSMWNGWIDEFRFSVGIARWTSNFTPPSSAYGPK
jgi:hypothetical protein